MGKREKAVSEVIGTVLIIAIVVPTFSAIVAWYIPATETPNESGFQSASQASYVNLISQLESPSIQQGQIISQNFQMGILGNMISPSRQSTFSYNSGGIYINASYQMSFKYHFLENTIPTAISNRVIGTVPTISGEEPTNVVLNPVNKSVAYVTDYASNSITEINVTTHNIIGNFYAGISPVDLVFVRPNYLFISNYYETYSSVTNIGHSTITVFDTINNTVVSTINSGGETQLLFPSGLLHLNKTTSAKLLGHTYSSGPYVYVLNYSQSGTGKYWEGLTQINATSMTIQRSFNLSSLSGLPYSVSPHYNVIISSAYNVWMTDYENKAILFGNYTRTLPFSTYSFSVTSENVPGYPAALSSAPVTGNINLLTSTSHIFVSLFNPSVTNYVNSRSPLFPSSKNIGQAYPGMVSEENYSEYLGYVPLKTVMDNVTAPTGLIYDSGKLYVLNYSTSYNTTSQFDYSNIVLFNLTSWHQTNIKVQSYGFFQQPVSVIPGVSNTLLIVDNGTNNVVFYDLPTKRISAYAWNNYLNSPVSMAYVPSIAKLAVVNKLSDTVALINPETGNLYYEFRVGFNPSSIAFNPASNKLYVTNAGSGNVSVISIQTTSTSASFTNTNLVGFSKPSFVTYDQFDQSMVVLSNSTGTIYRIGIGGTTTSFTSPFSNPVSATMGSHDNRIYIAVYSSTGNGGFYILNLSQPGSPLSGIIKAGSGTDSIAYDSYNNVVYVSNKFSKNVTAYNLTKGSPASIAVGNSPSSLLFDSDNGYLYVSNRQSNNLTLYNTFTGQIAYSIAGGHKPSYVTYYNGSGIVYFANEGSNQVTSVNGGTIYLSGSIASVGGFSTKQTYYARGSLSSFGYTSYVPPTGYTFLDNLLLTNLTNSNRITSSPNAPIAVSGSSGFYNISSFTLNLAGKAHSIASTGSSTLRLQLVNVTLNSFHRGEIISYTDLFGNSYPAVITAVSLLNMSYSIHTSYAKELNDLLYQRLKGETGSAPADWAFLGGSFTVSSSNHSINLDLTGKLPVYSAQFEYVSAYVVNL